MEHMRSKCENERWWSEAVHGSLDVYFYIVKYACRGMV